MGCILPGSAVVGFSGQEHWSGFPCPAPGDLLNPGIKPTSLTAPALAGRVFTTRTTWDAFGGPHVILKKSASYLKAVMQATPVIYSIRIISVTLQLLV